MASGPDRIELDPMRTPAVMVQGTGSNVGKSTLVTGLARAFARRGLSVRPFKPQNMSNNAAVTADGGEIGRAQAVQALAARVPASVHMNPVLLKPETDTASQVIVQGRRMGRLDSRRYGSRKETLIAAVMDSFGRLEREADIVLVEGAGSPAEINLRAGDIANMGFAEAADVPVLLVGDIDRGGVIASLVGTHAVLAEGDRTRIRAFAVNKFRGDPRLFDDGVAAVAARTGWPCLGVIPWLPAAAVLPAEDALDLELKDKPAGALHVAVPMLARIANFDDLDPLAQEDGVRLTFVRPGEPLPADAGLVVLPGSKATVADLRMLRAQGWDVDLAAHVRRGGRVLGLCGGFQMLGRTISDPEGVEGFGGTEPGLGLLDVETVLTPDKVTEPVAGIHVASGEPVEGYEIHLGRTEGADRARPVLTLRGSPEGASSPDGRVQGTYVHGLFASDGFRRAYLAGFGIASRLAYASAVETALEALADHLETHLDLDAILAMARTRQRKVRAT
jgi:adenosylcobyric acid synthase